MRRRLVVATASVAAAGVALTALVALLLGAAADRSATRAELQREARGLAVTVGADAPDTRLRQVAALLAQLRAPLRLEGAAIVPLSSPADRARARTLLPAGVPASALDEATNLGPDGVTAVTGTSGKVTWAAAPFTRSAVEGVRQVTVSGAVVITRATPGLLGPVLPWVLVAAAVVALGVAALVDVLARRMVAPLGALQAVTRRMAAGELTARAELPPAVDPEVADLTSSLGALGEALAAARDAQRSFLLTVSHDLRTPLTSIRGLAEALEDGAAADVRTAGRIIDGEAQRLTRLVDDLLELGRLEAGGFDVHAVPVDLGALAASSVAVVAARAAASGIAVESRVVAGGHALADPDRVAQVLANLVDNALAFARSRVEVDVAGASLTVRDDGPGIPPEQLDSVFTPWVSARPGRRPGAGLGLAIVARLVGGMGGRVEVAAPPGGGTSFTVSLPEPG